MERGDILGGHERPQLAAVGVAAHGGVQCPEVHVRVVLEPLREQDHAGTGAEHRLAGLDVLVDRVEQAGGVQELASSMFFAAL